MTPILKSRIAEYFDDFLPDQLAGVTWLDPDEASPVWRRWGDASARHLFELPSDHWSLVIEWSSVGSWLEVFNAGERLTEVPDVVLRASGWDAEQRVFMIQSSKQIVALTMRAFRVCWTGLFYAFDDTPLLVPGGPERGPVFMFTSLGDIRLAHRVR